MNLSLPDIINTIANRSGGNSMTKISEITRMYEKGNYANTYKEVAASNPGGVAGRHD